MKAYSCADQSEYDDDMLTLRAYLKAKIISQADFDGQRDAVRCCWLARVGASGAQRRMAGQMLHALRGGADFGYQGSNFVHNSEFIKIPNKKKNRKGEDD